MAIGLFPTDARAQAALFGHAGATLSSCAEDLTKRELLVSFGTELGGPLGRVNLTLGAIYDVCPGHHWTLTGGLQVWLYGRIAKMARNQVGLGFYLDGLYVGKAESVTSYTYSLRPEVIFRHGLAQIRNAGELESVAYFDVRGGLYKGRRLYVLAGITLFLP